MARSKKGAQKKIAASKVKEPLSPDSSKKFINTRPNASSTPAPKSNVTPRFNAAKKTSEISSNVRPFKAAKKTFLRGKKFETKVIARLPFYRLIKSVLLKLHTEQLRHGDSNAVSKITLTAINILQDLTEYFILYYMEDSLRAAYHSKRVTVMDKDFKLVKMLRESALSAQMAG